MSELLPVLRACELVETPKVPKWLIKDLWAAGGVGVLAGSPKSCKSWLGLEIAVSVATGTPCLGRFHIPAKGPSLVYFAEDALPVVKERLVALCAHRSLPLDTLDLRVISSPTLRLDIPADLQRLENTVDSLRPRCLLLDPLVRLHSRDENSSQEISPLLNSLRMLQRKYDTAIILVHHTRKSGSSTRRGLAMRGSGDIWAWGDSNCFLTHQGNKLVLSVEHRAAPSPEPISIELALAPPHLVVTEMDEAHPPALDDRIIEELSIGPDPVSRTELRKRLAVNNKRLGDALDSLEKNSTIVRTPQGLTLFGLPTPL